MSHSKDPYAYEGIFWDLGRRLAAREYGNDLVVYTHTFESRRQAIWFQAKFYAYLRAREWHLKRGEVAKEVRDSWAQETRACKAFQISVDGTSLLWVRKAKKAVFAGMEDSIEKQLPDRRQATVARTVAVPRLETPEVHVGTAYDFPPDDLPSEGDN